MPTDDDRDVSFLTVTIDGRWLLSQCSRCGALVVPLARGAADSEAQRLHVAYPGESGRTALLTVSRHLSRRPFLARDLPEIMPRYSTHSTLSPPPATAVELRGCGATQRGA